MAEVLSTGQKNLTHVFQWLEKGLTTVAGGRKSARRVSGIIPHAGYAHIRGLFDPSKPWPERMARPFSQADYQHFL